MNNISQLERNTFESFKKVKLDILQLNSEDNKASKAISRLTTENSKLHETVAVLSQKVADLSNALRHTMEIQQDMLKNKNSQRIIEKIKEVPVMQEVIKEVCTPNKKKSTTYIASKTGKNFHLTNCVFAKNIKPNKKIIFKTKEAMLNKGYKPCDCVKKY
jgi:predicted nuclease with TOPRIM domain